MQKLLVFTSLLALAASCNPTQKCVEKIDPACVCPMDYNPVCGCNNKTYGNACAAECAGIKAYTPGECPQNTSLKLEGPTWRLMTFAVSPEPQQVPDDVEIFVRLEGGQLSGSGGCNRIGGSYATEGPKLSTAQLFSTKMYCEKSMTLETRFFQMLEKSRSYSIREGRLEVDCGDMGGLVFQQKNASN